MTALRRTQLARLGAWISLATLAVIAVFLVARTETGIRRIATLLAPAETARTSKAPQIANRPSDQEAEQRRLAEAVRTLNADRDRLAARLTVLERNLDEVTGSIPPAVATAKAPQVPVPSVAASPLPPPATPPVQGGPPAQTNQRVAAGHLATGTSAADSVATRTEFGVDIGATGRGILDWAVFAPTGGAPRGALAGSYGGVTGSVTVGVGLGANVLVGGNANTIALQPVSVDASTGLNVAAGVAGMTLAYVARH